MAGTAEPRLASTPQDEALVRAAQSGDAPAFEILYRRYARMVHGILLARLPATDVDDLVQEVFLTVFRKLKRLKEPAAFGGWIAAIARNRATDFHRSTRELESLEPESEVQASNRDSLSSVIVIEALRNLPEAYRETLVLRLVEGLTGPEIAERTGLTHGSVRVNLSRGMQMLREALAERRKP